MTIRISRLIGGLLLLLVVAGCATMTPSTLQPPLNQPLSWQQRQQQLQTITQWHIHGRIAVRTKEKSGSADIQWWQRQPERNYHITVFGALGVSMVEIISTPQQVELINSTNQRFTANDAETLLYKNSGWDLPVNSLYYWIRGLPAPGTQAEVTFDHYNHPERLKQSGWIVQYLKYASVNDRVDLPTFIKITHDGISIKLLISNWKIDP